MRSAARVLSVVLHPLLMPTFTLWLALRTDLHLSYFMNTELRWILLGMVALMTVAFPLTSALLLIRAGMLSSLLMPGRRERIGPYIMTVLYFGMTWYLLYRTTLHPAALALFTGATLALILTLLITLRWKISAHMVGIGGCLGAIVGLNILHGLQLFLPIVILVLMAGALGTARLLSSDHTPAQIYTGAALGIACTSASVLLPWWTLI